MDITPPQSLSPASLNQLAGASRRPPEVEETEPSEIAEDTEKSVNAIRATEISMKTLTKDADEATNLEDFASDKEKSAADKNPVVAKGKAAKASTTDANLEKLKFDQCNYTKSFQKR